jgi:two-component system, chemotaxis family, CheB/CheR fusion protein
MSEAGAQSGRPLRVLVVDDNVEHVVTTKLLLLHAGFEVSIALRGREVFAEVGRFKPEAILLDIGLPELSGYEIARDLRIAHPHMLIVAVTAYGTQTDRMLAAMAGFDHHVTKPYDPNAMVSLLERHAARLARGESARSWPFEPGLGQKQDGPAGNSM